MRKTITIGIVLVMVLMGFVALANPIASNEVPTGTIEKSISDNTIFLGDYEWVTIDVWVSEGVMTVEDHLPEILSYMPGTLTVNDIPVTPVIIDHVIYVDVGAGNSQIVFQVIMDSAPMPAPGKGYWNLAYLMDGERTVDSHSLFIWGVKYCGFDKYFLNMQDEDGDGIIEVGEEIKWNFMISVGNLYDWVMVDVMVWDRFGGEIEFDEDPVVTTGIWNVKTKGRTKKIFLTWAIGDMDPHVNEILTVNVSTDKNPKGHQEYTSPGIYELNSGAVLKFLNPDGIQLSANTPPVIIEVFEPN